jgi:hypothetical protein
MSLIFVAHSYTCEYHTDISRAVPVKMQAMSLNASVPLNVVENRKLEFHFSVSKRCEQSRLKKKRLKVEHASCNYNIFICTESLNGKSRRFFNYEA